MNLIKSLLTASTLALVSGHASVPVSANELPWAASTCTDTITVNSVICQYPSLRRLLKINYDLASKTQVRLDPAAYSEFNGYLDHIFGQGVGYCYTQKPRQLEECVTLTLKNIEIEYHKKLAALGMTPMAPATTVVAPRTGQTPLPPARFPQTAAEAGYAPLSPPNATTPSQPTQQPVSRVLRITGEITDDDVKSFDRTITTTRISYITLDSNGGNVLAGHQLAQRIRQHHLTTIVPDRAVCASACFMLFAAGERRSAGATAKIGVHGASDPVDGETATAYAVDTLMARDYAVYGVPDSIIGKMVRTPANEIAWLDAADLQAMHVEITSPNWAANR